MAKKTKKAAKPAANKSAKRTAKKPAPAPKKAKAANPPAKVRRFSFDEVLEAAKVAMRQGAAESSEPHTVFEASPPSQAASGGVLTEMLSTEPRDAVVLYVPPEAVKGVPRAKKPKHARKAIKATKADMAEMSLELPRKGSHSIPRLLPKLKAEQQEAAAAKGSVSRKLQALHAEVDSLFDEAQRRKEAQQQALRELLSNAEAEKGREEGRESQQSRRERTDKIDRAQRYLQFQASARIAILDVITGISEAHAAQAMHGSRQPAYLERAEKHLSDARQKLSEAMGAIKPMKEFVPSYARKAT